MSLPPFPVDDITLNVVRDSLDEVIEYVDPSTGHVTKKGPGFGLHDVLNMLSGFDPALVREEPTYGISFYPGEIYSVEDVIGALIDEIRRLRAAAPTISA